MLFSSIPFLYWFLPCVVLLYFAAPRGLKNTVLLLSSLFFYGWGEPVYVLWMLLAIVMAYLSGLLIERFRSTLRLARIFLVLSVSFSLAMLGYFKYADFFIRNFNAVTGLSVPLLKIALPIGISFYTFQILSYTVDVYRGAVFAQKNFIDLAAYVALFPQLIAGPIVRYADVAAQLKERRHTQEKTALGMRRFLLGLGKKVLIANLLGELCSIFRESNDKSVLFSGFTLQHMHFMCILIFPATAIWQSGSAKYSALISGRISIIRLFRRALLSSGAAGICRLAHGFGIMSIFPSEETASALPGICLIFWWSGC